MLPPFCLLGAPYIYQGEIGMTNRSLTHEIIGILKPLTLQYRSQPKIEPNSALQSIYKIGRDNAKQCMERRRNAGFSRKAMDKA